MSLGLFVAMLIICLPGAWIMLNSLRPTVEIMAKPPVWIPQELMLDAYRSMFGVVGQGGIPVLGLLPQFADHLGHLDGHRDRHRHVRRLRLRALSASAASRRCSSA